MIPSFASQLSQEYKKHHLFVELEEMKSFYDDLSDRLFNFVSTSTKALVNYESYYLMSIYGTLDSVKKILEIGRINDSIVLVRKIFDDILTGIYFDVTIKDRLNDFESLYVEELQQWIDASFRIPTLKKILKVLEYSPYTKDLYPYFGWETNLKRYRHFLDDSVHLNSYSKVLYNCNTINIGENRVKLLNSLSVILKQLMTLHMSFLIHLNPVYFIASDYFDYCEFGETPPKGSESWFACFAQDAFDKYIKPYPKLANYIKSNCCLNIL